MLGWLKQFFIDLFVWMFGWIWDLMGWVWDSVILPVVAWFGNMFMEILEWHLEVLGWCLKQFVEWLCSILPIPPYEELVQAFETLSGYMADINYFVPIYTIFHLWLAFFAVRMGIRGVRWIIGFIPTIEG